MVQVLCAARSARAGVVAGSSQEEAMRVLCEEAHTENLMGSKCLL